MKRFLRIIAVILMILSVYVAIAIMIVMKDYLSDIPGNWAPLLQMLIMLGILAAIFFGARVLFKKNKTVKKDAAARAVPHANMPAAPTPAEAAAPEATRRTTAAPASPAAPSAPAEAQRAAAAPISQAEPSAPAETQRTAAAPASPDEPAAKPAPNTRANAQVWDAPMLDEPSFIQDMKHQVSGHWHQYDVLLAARGYGWETMLDWADYMEKADLGPLGTLTTQEIAGAGEREWIDEYRASGETLRSFGPLTAERGVLAIGGGSRAIPSPVKIVWFNQTRVLRVFSLLDDKTLMRRYIETVIRRSFGSPEAMRLARRIPAPKARKQEEPKPRADRPKDVDEGSIGEILGVFDSPDEFFATAHHYCFTAFRPLDYFSQDWADHFEAGHYVIFVEERHSVYENGKCIYHNPHFTGEPDATYRDGQPAYTLLIDDFRRSGPLRVSGGELAGNWLLNHHQLKVYPLELACKEAAAASLILNHRTAVVRIVKDYDKY